MNFLIEEIASIIRAEACIRQPGSRIGHLLTDSRNLASAADSLFFALKTASNNGHKYLADLYRKGVRHFVVSEMPDPASLPQADLLLVPDTVRALQQTAAAWRCRFTAPVLALAGSNGKTIVKEWLWQLLRDDLNISRSPGSFNSQIGVPLSLSLLDLESRLGIIEAGISQPGEMAALEAMIRPDWGLMTNIGAAHQENFRDKEQKLEEKFLLFKNCRCLVYCADDAAVSARAKALAPACRLHGWSMHDAPARYQFRIEPREEYTWVHTFHRGEETNWLFPFTDVASIQNLLHCLAFIFMMETEISDYRIGNAELERRVRQLEPVAMRLEVKEGRNGIVLINDTYNSDLQALELALDFQHRRGVARTMQRSLILSDIYQSGQRPEVLYRQVAELVAQRKISRFIGIGRDLAASSALFPPTSSFFLTTEDFLSSSLIDELHDELILIKGSRKFGFERISARLSLKSHETRMEVNLDAIVHNYNYFRSLLKPETRMTVMVKAESYGLGALEVSRTLQAHGADAVAVAVADEGVRLRQGGIHIPVMVMNPDVSVLPICYEYKLEPEVYSFRLLEAFIQAGERLGVRDYPIHIKLDTGMHRLGFSEDDLPRLIAMLRFQHVLSVSTVFTHLAGSDDERFDDYTMQQWQRFDAMSRQLQAAMAYPVERHILNSAGIERFPQWQCERVRLGVGLYGVSAVHPEALKATASLKTRILQIHRFKAGESIGYSRTTVLDHDTDVATLPIGYADGLNRHNRDAEVWIDGHRARLLGSICMDACMADVTGLPVKEGDTVEIFGENITISEVARRLDTIPYEVLTSVSQRVKRVYFHE
ncbi:MAG: bifunctional UDP-N-acetylmuramoyl-tripeptide:D-alanyl-D-alanine ligase/alanine racemase [Bacteroidales bacterium]|nr:bifunctional UDP-N-acetylmuramoyl-tripeptide:D-alanyl-D-alanine ligase/alanine racemase [Bacteroidales bacterium]